MKNSLGLRHRPLGRLRVGEAVLVGPYNHAKAAATLIFRCRKESGREGWQFTQQQMLLCDPGAGTCIKMYLITRTG